MARSCTFLVHHLDKGTPALPEQMIKSLEGDDVPSKIYAMKKAIIFLINGEPLPNIFSTIVSHILPCDDHTIQKLLLLYLETIGYTKLRLICRHLRNHLHHPNEYLRGRTLRLLCRISDFKTLKTLIPSILSNLRHRHPYVRRNAILAAMCMYLLPRGKQLFPNAPETIDYTLALEKDPSTRRHAFLMLSNCATDRAVDYLFQHACKLPMLGDLLQMAVLYLIRKVWGVRKADQKKYLRIIFALLNPTSSPAIRYESTVILIFVQPASSAIGTAIDIFCEMLLSPSDDNIKLIILKHLRNLMTFHREKLVDKMEDFLCMFASPNLDIRRKTLEIVLNLVTPDNIDEVFDVVKTQFKQFIIDGGVITDAIRNRWKKMMVLDATGT